MKSLVTHAHVSHWIWFDSDPHLYSQIVSREFHGQGDTHELSCRPFPSLKTNMTIFSASSISFSKLTTRSFHWCREVEWQTSYAELLSEKLSVVGWAKPVLLLQVVHGDGQVGLSDRRRSGQKDHRLLICEQRNHWFHYGCLTGIWPLECWVKLLMIHLFKNENKTYWVWDYIYYIKFWDYFLDHWQIILIPPSQNWHPHSGLFFCVLYLGISSVLVWPININNDRSNVCWHIKTWNQKIKAPKLNR